MTGLAAAFASTVADGSSITNTVIDGPFVLAAGLALAAGIVSFASPCVLPLVPGYLSYLTGLVGAATSAAGSAAGSAEAGTDSGAQAAKAKTDAAVRKRALLATALFVAGFTVVFVAESMLLLGAASFLGNNTALLTRIGGAVVIVVGLAMLGVIKPLQREARVHARPTGRITGAPLLGAFFALGWTACLGPTLLGVNSLVISSDWNGNAWRGMLLVVLYCAGIGVPFLLLAFGFGWASTAMQFLRRHSKTIQRVGAVMLIVMGILMVTGVWTDVMVWLQVRFISTATTVL